MKPFSERLFAAVRAAGNPTVLGLDPKPAYVPAFLGDAAAAEGAELTRLIVAYNELLLTSLQGIVAVVKPQMAYYEALGLPGLNALAETMQTAKTLGYMIILDGKRNDIGSTAEAYASAYLSAAGGNPFALADALTVNPYLGFDGIKPFVELCQANGKGIFALVRTSNPSASDLQDLELADGRKLYEAAASLVSAWGESSVNADGYSPVGAVVGATWPAQAEGLRRQMPHTPILVPGYGAQGGKADDCALLFDSRGLGAVVNASRSLMLAYQKAGAADEASFKAATKAAALAMRDDLLGALRRSGKDEAFGGGTGGGEGI